METINQKWHEQSTAEQTRSFIDYINEKYYKSYLYESERFERLNFWTHMSIVLLGFSVTIILGIKKIFGFTDPLISNIFDMAILILPSVSSVIMMYISQRGFKKKEEIRENARIECKYLINEARLKYSFCHSEEDYMKLYHWLNVAVKHLQLAQAESYFQAESKMVKEE